MKYDDYPDDTAATLKAKGYNYGHSGGQIMLWAKEDKDKDLFVYLGADNPSEGMASSAGVDVMSFDGDHRDSRSFPTLAEAIAYAERLFARDGREQFRQDMILWLEKEARDGNFAIEDVIALTVSRAGREIAGDVKSGLIPDTVRSFSQLHDHVDANGYGGAFDWPCLSSEHGDEDYQQAFTDFWNAVQNRLDAWISRGEMRQGLRQPGKGNGR